MLLLRHLMAAKTIPRPAAAVYCEGKLCSVTLLRVTFTNTQLAEPFLPLLLYTTMEQFQLFFSLSSISSSSFRLESLLLLLPPESTRVWAIDHPGRFSTEPSQERSRNLSASGERERERERERLQLWLPPHTGCTQCARASSFHLNVGPISANPPFYCALCVCFFRNTYNMTSPVANARFFSNASNSEGSP